MFTVVVFVNHLDSIVADLTYTTAMASKKADMTPEEIEAKEKEEFETGPLRLVSGVVNIKVNAVLE